MTTDILDLDPIRSVDDLTLTLNEHYTATGTLRFDMPNGILEFIVDGEAEMLNTNVAPTLPNTVFISNDHYPGLVDQLIAAKLVTYYDDTAFRYGPYGATASWVFITMGTQIAVAAG